MRCIAKYVFYAHTSDAMIRFTWIHYLDSTVNVTGETLVLKKGFPSINQGFSQYYARKFGKMNIFPA